MSEKELLKKNQYIDQAGVVHILVTYPDGYERWVPSPVQPPAPDAFSELGVSPTPDGPPPLNPAQSFTIWRR